MPFSPRSAAFGVFALALCAGLTQMPGARAEEAPRAIMLDRGFTLSDADGKPVASADFAGKWLLVYFGYTHCADQCPTSLSTMTEAIDELGPAASLVQPLFVTVDPERDHGPALRDFTAAFDKRLVGLTGSPAEIRAVADRLGIRYDKILAGSDDYVIDHSTVLTLIAPDGKQAITFAMAEPYRITAEIFAALRQGGAKLENVGNIGAYR